MKADTRIHKLSLGSFNFIKGVAICVIILGHIAMEFDVQELTWFYPLFALLSFLKTPLIPLFFMIGGYGLAVNRADIALKKSFRSLIVPYIFVMIVFCITLPVFDYVRTLDGQQAINTGLSVFLAFLLGIPIPGKVLFGITLSHCAIVWFLLAMFWAYNITNLILKRRNLIEQILWILLCAFLGYALFLLDFTYFCIPHGLIAASYFYIGSILKKYKLLEKKLPHAWMYIVWGVLAVLYSVWGYFDLCYGQFAFFPADYIGTAILALLLLLIGIHLNNLDWRIFDPIHNIGAYSYWVLCIHSIEQKCLPWRKLVLLTENHPNLGFLTALVIKSIIIILFCAAMKKLTRWKFRKQKKYYGQKKEHAATDRTADKG